MNAETKHGGPVDVLAVLECAAETLVRMKGAGANARLVHVQRDALNEASAAVAELIKSDHEYDAARVEWDNAIAGDPSGLSDKDWQRIATRFEEACVHRIAALARVGGAA